MLQFAIYLPGYLLLAVGVKLSDRVKEISKISMQPSITNVSIQAFLKSIDSACLAEKSARKDEKTLFWPPPTSLVWLPNQPETKQCQNN